MRRHLSTLAGTIAALMLAGPASAAPEPTTEQIRAAVQRSLPLLQKSAAEYTEHRQCFACHHQAVPLLAVSTAKARGFKVDEKGMEKQARFTATSLTKGRDRYKEGRGQGGQVDTAGYALLALDVGGWKADETTAAVAEYLLLRDKDRDHWRTNSRRPPSEASSFTTTYLALRGLRKFATPEQQKRVAARTDKVRRWLLKTPAADTEDRVFRLRGLKLAGAEDKEVQEAAKVLRESQRDDGGWAQTDKLKSDAYATGSALVALHRAGGLATDDPVYRRGLKFLIDTQREDGSWLVHSRSRPFQIYFESGFPHGKDQFISIAASAWATAALALACDEEESFSQRRKERKEKKEKDKK